VRDAKVWFFIKARPTSYVSAVLINQLALHASRFGDFHACRRYHFHFHSILDAIAQVEGKSRAKSTKPQARFKSGLLKGIWHKHFSDAQFLPNNLRNEVEKNFDSLWRTFGRLRREAGLAGTQLVDQLASLLAHTFAMKAFECRAGTQGGRSRITGEWILFEERKGARVFLTLTTHHEAARTPEILSDRIEQARANTFFIGDFAALTETT
jgi:hypothetical protein